MAAELIVNFDELDLTQIAVSRDQIDGLIPQTGDMRQIDHLVWVNEERSACVAVRHVRDDEFWVPGHIPGRPLLPGVMMIEAAAQASAVLYRLRTGNERFIGFVRLDDVVFRGQVVPGDTVYFIANERECKPRRFVTATQAVLNGTLIFEGVITGMPV